MDFNKFNARAAADEGFWYHLIDPANGKPLYDGDQKKPCRLKLLGATGREAIKRIREVQKQDKLDDPFDQIVRELSPLVVGMENIDRDGKPATAEDAAWLLGMIAPDIQSGRITDDDLSFVAQVDRASTGYGKDLGNSGRG